MKKTLADQIRELKYRNSDLKTQNKVKLLVLILFALIGVVLVYHLSSAYIDLEKAKEKISRLEMRDENRQRLADIREACNKLSLVSKKDFRFLSMSETCFLNLESNTGISFSRVEDIEAAILHYKLGK